MEIEKLREKLQNKSVLFIEDDLEINQEFSELLSLLCKEAVSAFDGVQGLKLYIPNKFDVVITDITMPHMNGFELTKNIKEINSDQKMIAMSGDPKTDFDDSYLFDFWIRKPVEMDELFDTLDKAF